VTGIFPDVTEPGRWPHVFLAADSRLRMEFTDDDARRQFLKWLYNVWPGQDARPALGHDHQIGPD
jgi:hypothetical protein